MKIGHNFGFTLAEVLITLAIIGVVAAMTLPTLIQNQQKRSLEVATQKFYSNMSQAVKKYMADEGVDDLKDTPLLAADPDGATDEDWHKAQKACEEFIPKYLRVAKVCEDGCFADYYTLQNGKVSDSIGEKAKFNHMYKGKFVLVDGGVLGILADCIHGSIDLFIDINGRKGPNKTGYDWWIMTIFHDGSINESSLNPECRKYGGAYYCAAGGASPDDVIEERFDGCLDGNYGGCFGHFLENGFKFDY